MEKTWNIKAKSSEDIIQDLFGLRGFSAAEKDNFLNPPHPKTGFGSIDWNLEESVNLIKSHIQKGSDIFIHGDYDVDGICATAILYKTIRNDLSHKNTYFFIPDRFEDGYGLSFSSVDKISAQSKSPSKLLITVDCGITAIETCEYAKSKGFEVLITDHHNPGPALPNPTVLLWTDRLAGSGISFALSSYLIGSKNEYLAYASLATVADLMPLSNYNRAIVKHGLLIINSDPPPGLKKLMDVSGILGKTVSTYELGWILSPRLNAAGRLESANDSLRLLIDGSDMDLGLIASSLNRVNLERQQKTVQMFEHAKSSIDPSQKVIVAKSPDYHEGIIGLVAGKIVQEFYRPSIAISIGPEFSKGSARSISKVSIIEILRKLSIEYTGIGGHLMAAGFTIKTSDLGKFEEELKRVSDAEIADSSLIPSLDIDLEIPPDLITTELCYGLKQFEPFGLGNPEPVFAIKNLGVAEARVVGSGANHLKLKLMDSKTGKAINAIYFGGGKTADLLNRNSRVDIAFNIRENNFNGVFSVDLHIKDIRNLYVVCKKD